MRQDNWLEAKQLSTMGQELAALHPWYTEYMGSDVEIAKSIAVLNVLVEAHVLNAEDVKLIKSLLIEQNRATFASGEKTDNLTKISLGLSKEEVPPADGSV